MGRATVSLPDDLLLAIDQIVKEKESNRSAEITRLLREALKGMNGESEIMIDELKSERDFLRGELAKASSVNLVLLNQKQLESGERKPWWKFWYR